MDKVCHTYLSKYNEQQSIIFIISMILSKLYQEKDKMLIFVDFLFAGFGWREC